MQKRLPMFYNFKDQILKSTETGTEYRYCGQLFEKVFVPLSWVL